MLSLIIEAATFAKTIGEQDFFHTIYYLVYYYKLKAWNSTAIKNSKTIEITIHIVDVEVFY